MNIILNSITFVSLGRKLQDDKNVHTALFVCLFVGWGLSDGTKSRRVGALTTWEGYYGFGHTQTNKPTFIL